MPCNCDYMEPSDAEINSLAVLKFIKELGGTTGKYSPSYGRVTTLTKDVSKLCSMCQKVDIKKYSLELQIWWRDHQAADRKRIANDVKKERTKRERRIAISKLSPYERKLLNLE